MNQVAILAQVVAVTTIEVIAEPSRRQILAELLNGEQSVKLSSTLAMTQPAVSKHLRNLRRHQLVTVIPTANAPCIASSPTLSELDRPYRQM